MGRCFRCEVRGDAKELIVWIVRRERKETINYPGSQTQDSKTIEVSIFFRFETYNSFAARIKL